MRRVLIAVLAAMWLPWLPAEATEQVPERFVIDGRVHHVRWVEPLKEKLAEFDVMPFQREIVSTNLWRGYVGTWLVEDDVLYLRSLVRYVYEPAADGGPTRRVAKDIPLSAVFKGAAGPVPAIWWSGQITVPRGAMLRQGWRYPVLRHAQGLYLRIENGRVVRRRLVDHRKEGRGLSREDIQWVLREDEHPADDATWHDARAIRSAAFRRRVPAGTPFKTRGILATSSDGTKALYIPATPATQNLRFDLADIPEQWKPGAYDHVEIVARFAQQGRGDVLRVESGRSLKPGETIHHPQFEAPPLPQSKLPPGDQEPRGALNYYTKVGGFEHAVGRLVGLEGTLVVAEKRASVHGVEVALDSEFKGKPALVEGILQHWVITPGLLERNPEVARLFGDRGPGEYWRLVHPTSGALSRPRPTKSK